jgi:homoserine kinase type II
MAVYTDVTAEDLGRFLSGYDVGELLAYKGIAEGVENSNFLVHTATGNFILTLYEKRVAEGDLPFFLGLMEHLAARGITCPQPVKNKQGGVLGKIAGRPAAIVTFLDGLWIRRPSPGHCAAVGEALAQLHLADADLKLKRANALSIESRRPCMSTRSRAAIACARPLGRNRQEPMRWKIVAAPIAAGRSADLFPTTSFSGDNCRV